MNKNTKDYKNLLVWQKSCALVKKGLNILRRVNKDFVSWAITKQAVRSLFSIRSNIVEGWCSHQGKSFVSYLEISRGSAGESEDWFYALCDEGYITKAAYDDIAKDFRELMAMLTGLVKKIKSENDK